MNDLVLAAATLAGVSLALFFAAKRLSKRLSPRAATLAATAAVLAMIVYVALLWDNVLLARWLPFSGLIILGNWFPLFVSIVGGIAWDRLPGNRVRKGAYMAGLAGIGVFAVAHPLLGSTPRCQNLWDEDVCLQTSEDTCSPACAATLLKAVGIESTEQELADLCLTRPGGTTWQGLYRGLKSKTRGSDWDVEVFALETSALRALDGPAILAVGVPKGADVDPIYTEQYGWTPGEQHSVLYYGYASDDRVDMAEPTPGVGHEQWSADDLAVLYRGRGLRLVRR